MNSTEIINSTNTTDDGNLFFIHNFGLGAEVRRGCDVYLFLAYTCLVVSYLARNILVLRIIICLGCFFFFLFGFLSEFAIQIDSVIFNFIFVVINIYHIQNIIKKNLPPKFNTLEETCYERDFKEVFDKMQFNYFLKKCKIDYLSMNESQICKVGQSFKELIYIAHINDGYSVVLEDSKGKLISYLKPGSWIGCIEYAKRDFIMKEPILEKLIKSGKLELVWQVSALIREKSKYEEKEVEVGIKKVVKKDGVNLSDSNLNIGKDEFLKLKGYFEEGNEIMEELKLFLRNRSNGCIVYRISMEALQKLYFDLSFPFVYKNGLQTLWLSYLTNYVVTQNIYLSEYFKNYEIEELGIASEEKLQLRRILASLKNKEDQAFILNTFKHNVKHNDYSEYKNVNSEGNELDHMKTEERLLNKIQNQEIELTDK